MREEGCEKAGIRLQSKQSELKVISAIADRCWKLLIYNLVQEV